jgi:LmbE family N-acetylglucosaminyl deacetylase
MKPFALLALALSLTAASAQTFTDPANLSGERVRPRDGRELPIDTGAQGLQQLLRKLNTRASVMNIVAHPDDEDGGMLTLYSRGLGARVADLSLNRGEGGQNAMTSDFEDALGLLRTQELLAADRYTGVDQFFGTEVDFGFSKTKEEAFAKWSHDRVLYDVVRAIRIYRPLVLTSTWIGGVTDGHGQHQVSGQIAQEAFLAAGDPKVFPELTAEGILPWQPLKIYARVPMQSISDRGLFDYATGQYMPAKFTNYVTGEVTTTVPSTDVVVHEGTKDPLLTYGGARALDLFGKVNPDTELSYVQFARIGLGLQKSQVSPDERQAPQGAYDVAYHLYGSCLPGSPTRHLCHLSDPSSNLSSRPESAHSTSNLSSRPESAHFADAAERPAVPPASTTISAPSGDAPNFFDGIDTSLPGLLTHAPQHLQTEIAKLDNLLTAASTQFDPEHPEKIAPMLGDALSQLQRNIIAEINADGDWANGSQAANLLHELRIKDAQLEEALALALGIKLNVTIPSSTITASTPTPAKTHIEAPVNKDLKFVLADFQSGLTGESIMGETFICLAPGKPQPFGSIRSTPFVSPMLQECTLPVTVTSTITRPYFTRPNIEQPVYDLLNPRLRNAPSTPNALTFWATFEYHQANVSIGAVAEHTNQPVTIVPPDSLTLPTHAQVFLNDQPSLRLTATVAPFTAITTEPKLTAPAPWKLKDVTYKQTGPNTFSAVDPDTTLGESVWQLTGPSRSGDSKPFMVTATATYGGKTITEGYRPVGYPDLPRTNYFTPAEVRIVPVKLTLPAKKKIAYLPGTGDSIPEALASINLTPTTLTVADLTPTKLAQYDTVILGVRAYAAHADLHGAPTQALLDFARNGGNVIVQYQTPEFTAADAPYPLSLGSNEKVVDETAPVRLPEDHDYGERLLVVPNKLTSADFDGWVEERGHGFLSSWDSHYSAPTETHDPGQDPQRGGLITTQLGKGRWTYIAFALYRQLPEAVPGAFRLFANLLSPE